MGLEFQLDDGRAQFGVEADVRVLLLGFAENCLNNDGLLLLVDLNALSLFLVEAFLAHQFCVADQKFTKFTTLLFEIIRTDLVEPKSDPLEILFLRLGLFHVLLGLLLELLDLLIFLNAPFITTTGSLVAVPSLSVRIATFLKFVAISTITTITLCRLLPWSLVL